MATAPSILFHKYHQRIPASSAATVLLVVAVAPLRLLFAPCLATKSIRNFFALPVKQNSSRGRKLAPARPCRASLRLRCARRPDRQRRARSASGRRRNV